MSDTDCQKGRAPDDSDKKFIKFVKEFLPELDEKTVQREVAVCYWESVTSQWLLAIPISEPKASPSAF